jgi:outer membrane receptor protein involved in Fe transport
VSDRFHSSVTLWMLDLASELLFVGDAGTTEATRPSRRTGFEWSSVYTPVPWLVLDADLAYSKARFHDADPTGDRIPGAVEGVASAGVTFRGRGPVSASLRLRYFGPRPLIEDNSVRSKASTTLNAHIGWQIDTRLALGLDAFNLTNAKINDIDYYYRSRLRGEPAQGIDDIHSHPLPPLRVRLSFTASF